MRLVTGLLAIAALAVPVHVRGQGAAAAPTRADVQKLFDARDDARHRGDWNAYGQFFTADATYIHSDGKAFKGRAQIQKDVQDQWGTGVYKGARMKMIVESVDAIAPTVAIADASYDISNIAGGGTRKGRTTVVLVASGGGWKIAATRSMVPTPAGAIRATR